MSEAQLLRYQDPAERSRQSTQQLGHVVTKKTRQKIRDSWANNGRAYTVRILAIIRESKPSEVMDYGKVAKQIYGEDSVLTRRRLCGIIYKLRSNKEIKKTGRNMWEILETK